MQAVTEQVNVWGNTLLAAMSAFWSEVAAFLPNLLAAGLILVLGWLLARMADALVSKVLGKLGVDRLAAGVGVSDILARGNIQLGASGIVGRLVFWVLLLAFLVSATETLGLQRLSGTVDQFLLYLPKVFAAMVILLLGLLVANLVRDLVAGAAEGIGFDQAQPLAKLVRGVLVVVVVVLALGQLELQTDLLYQVISITLAAVAAASALAFGLGARDVAANILAGTYLRDDLPPGCRVQVGSVTGVLDQVGPVSTSVLLADGARASFANKRLLAQGVTVLPAAETPTA